MKNRRLELGVVAASAALLAYWAWGRKKPAPVADAFPFPTARSHATAAVDDEAALAAMATELDAKPESIKEAADVVGRSRAAIADYLKRR